MLEMTTKMILEMLLHRNEIQKRIFQTQSDCATFEMKTDPTEPFSSLPPQFIFNKFCSLGVSWEVAVWRRNDKLIMNSISPHTLPGSQLCRSWEGRVYIWYLLMKSLHDSLNIPQPIRAVQRPSSGLYLYPSWPGRSPECLDSLPWQTWWSS